MKIISIIQSILSAFFGVQNNNKFNQDNDFIEKNGVRHFLIVGFIMVFIMLSLLSFIVGCIVS